MSAALDLDSAIRAHAARLPAPTRALLTTAIAPDAPDAWVRDALLAYGRLWIRRFDLDEPLDTAERKLADELCAIVGRERTRDDDADVTAAEADLAVGFGKRGYAFLGGRTPPELGARLPRPRLAALANPRGPGAGGWYQQDNPPWPDGLYAVAERYPEPRETNPAFTVSLLGHEAQHVADHRAFPGLGSGDLEYRAKLVELIGFTLVRSASRSSSTMPRMTPGSRTRARPIGSWATSPIAFPPRRPTACVAGRALPGDPPRGPRAARRRYGTSPAAVLDSSFPGPMQEAAPCRRLPS